MTKFGMTCVFCCKERCDSCSLGREAKKDGQNVTCTKAMEYLYKKNPKFIYEKLKERIDCSKSKEKMVTRLDDTRHADAEREFEEYFRSVE